MNPPNSAPESLSVAARAGHSKPSSHRLHLRDLLPSRLHGSYHGNAFAEMRAHCSFRGELQLGRFEGDGTNPDGQWLPCNGFYFRKISNTQVG